MNVLLHTQDAAELPPDWSWCPDCDGTGLSAPDEPGAEEAECWSCRGLGVSTDDIL